MTKLRLLRVTFDCEIHPKQLSSFRAAIAQKVGLEHEWFHNHDNEKGGFHNRYPLIQYKLKTHLHKMQPMMLCLQEGIEEAHHFFSQPDWQVSVLGQTYDLKVADLHLDQIQIQTWDQSFQYRLHKWMPFNSDNYQEYMNLSGLVAQLRFLEEKLSRQIQSFGESIGWSVPQPLEVKLMSLLKTDYLQYKRVKALVFTIDFESNVSLPDFIGLGKGASRGMGVVRRHGPPRERYPLRRE